MTIPKWLFIALSRSFTIWVNCARERAVKCVGVLWMNSYNKLPPLLFFSPSYSTKYQTTSLQINEKFTFIMYHILSLPRALWYYCSKLSSIPSKKKEIKKNLLPPHLRTTEKNHDFFKAIQRFDRIVPKLALKVQVRSFSGRLIKRRSQHPLAHPSSSSPRTSSLALKSLYYEEMILLEEVSCDPVVCGHLQAPVV